LMTKSVGVYNYFGNGSQYYSWIHIDDLCHVFVEMIENDTISGVVNGVSPSPISNKDFTIVIKKALGGLLALPAPKFGLRLALGEMADVVLNSNRVIPRVLTQKDFYYRFPNLGEAVKDLVDRKA